MKLDECTTVEMLGEFVSMEPMNLKCSQDDLRRSQDFLIKSQELMKSHELRISQEIKRSQEMSRTFHNSQGTKIEVPKAATEEAAGVFMKLHDMDLVIAPSLFLSPYELTHYTSVTFLEERSMFYLLLLTDPTIRIFYVTSRTVDSANVDYYVRLLEKMGATNIRERIKMIGLNDVSSRTLTDKLLTRPELLSDMRKSIRKGKGGFITVKSDDDTLKVAELLGVKYLSNHPDKEGWGTKLGSRTLFEEAKVPYALGTKLVYDSDALAQTIVEMCERDASIRKFMVKLDVSFNGEGNAVLDLAVLGDNITAERVKEQFYRMRFSKPIETYETYSAHLDTIGVLAEQFLPNEISTPSFIGFISEDGEVHRLGTQQQILEGLEYMGAEYPADSSYRLRVQENGFKVGKVLASKGARGHFGVDFLVSADMSVYAVEVNLRPTGSTYPFMLAKLLVGGTVDPKSGLLMSSKGQSKSYRSLCYVHHEEYKKLTPGSVLSLMDKHGKLFDAESQTGVVFQMLGSVSEFGKFGMTCIANSYGEVDQLVNDVHEILARELGIN